MRLFSWRKDGGPESKVAGLFVVEIKHLFTVALLRFDEVSREAFHSHAFNSISWVLSGKLREEGLNGSVEWHRPRFVPVITRRSTFHKVLGLARATWVLTFRGPWSRTWREYIPETDKYETLTLGRARIT